MQVMCFGLGAVAIGYLADAWGRKPATILAVSIAAAAHIASSFAQTYGGFLTAFLVACKYFKNFFWGKCFIMRNTKMLLH